MMTPHNLRKTLRKYRLEFNELAKIAKDNKDISPDVIFGATGWSRSKCLDVFTTAQLVGLLQDPRISYLSGHEKVTSGVSQGREGIAEVPPDSVREQGELAEGPQDGGQHEQLG